ncbi:hypothetical protein Hanom_Chr04g00311411 [Helianthus anomalus]
MAMGIYRQGSLSGGELGREIPSAVRGTVQLPFFFFTKSETPLNLCTSSLFKHPHSHSLCSHQSVTNVQY